MNIVLDDGLFLNILKKENFWFRMNLYGCNIYICYYVNLYIINIFIYLMYMCMVLFWFILNVLDIKVR